MYTVLIFQDSEHDTCIYTVLIFQDSEHERAKLDRATLDANQHLAEELQRCRTELQSANRKLLELEAVKEDLECRVSHVEALEEELRDAQTLAEVRKKEVEALHQKVLGHEQRNTELESQCENLKTQV